MIGIKDGNGDLVSLANKSDKWAVYATKAAAEDALANGELAEGMIVGVTEKPGVITEGSSIITYATATLPIVASSGSEVEFYSYTNTTSSEADLYASYYNNYDTSQSGYYAGFYGVLNGSTIIKTGGTNAWSSISLQVHLRPGDTVILKGKRSNSALAATVEIDISTPTLEYVTDKLYAIEPNYSTTEVNTGKKWIDGKTIYRKAGFKSGNVSNAIIDSTLTMSYIQNIVDAGGSVTVFDAMVPVGGYADSNARSSLISRNNGLFYGTSGGTPHDLYWWIEYTKTIE